MKTKLFLCGAALCALSLPAVAAPVAAAQAAATADAAAPVSDLVSEVDIPYEQYTLANGLRVIVHTDRKAPIVAVSVWYDVGRSDEHTSELQSLMRISYAVFCLKIQNMDTVISN